jgi:hypothetical protein
MMNWSETGDNLLFGVEKDSGFFASLKNDTKKRATSKAGVDVAQVQHEPQNPHLPAATPAGLLSRKVTGEVIPRPPTKEAPTGTKSRIFFSYHWVQG